MNLYFMMGLPKQEWPLLGAFVRNETPHIRNGAGPDFIPEYRPMQALHSRELQGSVRGQTSRDGLAGDSLKLVGVTSGMRNKKTRGFQQSLIQTLIG